MKLKHALTLILLICGGVNAAHAYELGDASHPITGGIISWEGYACSNFEGTTECTLWPGSHQFGDCNHKAIIPYRQLPTNKDQYGGRPFIRGYYHDRPVVRYGYYSVPYYVESWNENGDVKFALHMPNVAWIPVNGSFFACVKGPD